MIDLHGLTVHQAYNLINEVISDLYYKIGKKKKISVITGKSGQIKREFDTWLQNNVYVKSWTTDNSGGKYTIKIKERLK